MAKVMGLCEGRHILPVKEFIFTKNALMGDIFKGDWENEWFRQIEKAIEPTKELVVYVTGLTPVAMAVAKYCHIHDIGLTLMHYDVKKSEYVRQEMW